MDQLDTLPFDADACLSKLQAPIIAIDSPEKVASPEDVPVDPPNPVIQEVQPPASALAKVTPAKCRHWKSKMCWALRVHLPGLTNMPRRM